MIGCFLGGWAGDKYGRIKGIAFGAAFAIVGAALQCSALNVPWILIARIVNGIGTGILNSVVPVWVCVRVLVSAQFAALIHWIRPQR